MRNAYYTDLKNNHLCDTIENLEIEKVLRIFDYFFIVKTRGINRTQFTVSP